MKTTTNRPLERPPLHRSTQRGIALVVSLVLLVVATLIGISGVSNITLQERMSSNLYDRSLAMQKAEAGQRAASAAILANPEGPSWAEADKTWPSCEIIRGATEESPGKPTKPSKPAKAPEDEDDAELAEKCFSIPANTFTGTSDDWHPATRVAPAVEGGGPRDFIINNDMTHGTPDFFIQYLGESTVVSGLGLERSANPDQYGEPSGLIPVETYRVISRSHTPGTNNAQQRSFVAIETTQAKIE